MLIGSAPYTYSGTADAQLFLAVRGVPLNASKQPIAGASIAVAAEGGKRYGIVFDPGASVDGQSRSDGGICAGGDRGQDQQRGGLCEAVPYRHKW